MTTTIGFHPALPCCTMRDADGALCGKAATVGTLYPAAGGLWLVQPFCRECALALVSAHAPETDELFPPAVESGAERIADRAIRVVGAFKRFGDDDWIDRASTDGRR